MFIQGKADEYELDFLNPVSQNKFSQHFKAINPQGITFFIKKTRFRSEFEKNFILNEGRVRIDHPNILNAVESICTETAVYTVFKMIEGQSLKELSESRQWKKWRKQHLKNCANELLSALHKAHQLGFLHLDIKPANIFIENPFSEIPKAYLIDWGRAKHPQQEAGKQHFSMVYSPPEQVLKQAKIYNATTDLFAFAVTYLEMVSNQNIYSGKLPMELINLQIAHPINIPKTLNENERDFLKSILIKPSFEKVPQAYSRLGLKALLQKSMEKRGIAYII